MSGHFTPALFKFLRDLKANNNREWFQANRERYVADVESPMLQFITDMGTRLPAISKMVKADPRRMGGSMYRIYRDTRFSADKTPYKTWAAVHFKVRAGKEQASPGFYLHVGPGERWAGGGIYHPEMPALTRIRQYIASHPKEWDKVLRSKIEIEGESLSRGPAGFDPGHKFITDLKRKDFYAGTEYSEREVTAPNFIDAYVEECKRVAPLMAFLSNALGLRW